MRVVLTRPAPHNALVALRESDLAQSVEEEVPENTWLEHDQIRQQTDVAFANVRVDQTRAAWTQLDTHIDI